MFFRIVSVIVIVLVIAIAVNWFMTADHGALKASSEEKLQKLNDAASNATTQAKETSEQLSARLEKERQEAARRIDKANGALAQAGSNLKQAVGDLSHPSDRTSIAFHLTKSAAPQHVGDLGLVLESTDVAGGSVALKVYAGGRLIKGVDAKMSEPLKLYLPGDPQLHEIVIDQINADDASGHLTVPKTAATASE